MTLLPEVRSQLHAAADRRSQRSRNGLLGRLPSPRLRGGWWRASLIALGAALVLVAGAFGAGLIKLGAPAKLLPFSLYGNAREGSGAPVPGSVRLLPIAAPDPSGGPDWGMRVLSTTRGEGCLQLGRLVDGKLGALGQDDAFANDGRFHELPVSTFDFNGCALLDANGRLFTNVTADERAASAWNGTGGRLAGCVPPSAGPYEKGLRLTRREKELGAKPAPICPQADLRNIYYGLLGPEAQSITYVLAGQRHTLPTVGADGAYMFVTLASAHQLLNFANAGTADIVPVDGPIKEIHYRNGSTCHLTSKSWIGGAYACTPSLSEPVGYITVGKAPDAARVATPIHARVAHPRHGRYVVTVSFTARLAVTDAHRVYDISWREPGMPPGAYGGEATNTNIAAGQTITRTIGEYGPRVRAGLVSGSVTLRQAPGPGGIEGPGSVSVPVGSFAVRVP
jgi:hypothetical protein